MIKRYSLTKSIYSDEYLDNGRFMLCGEGLRKYFKLREGVESIDLLLSSTRIEHSYHVKIRCQFLKIEDQWSTLVYSALEEAIYEMGGECYLAIEV